MTGIATRSGLGALFGSAAFLRLWAIGSCVNTMRWFEVLAAALFTLDVTGSGFAVAIVSAARTMPMLLLGAFSGVVTEALNRKHVLFAGQVLTCLASAAVALLGLAGIARPWHIVLTATVAGIVWSTENATRRRMVGECVEPPLVSRALALDTMSNSVTRLVGPLAAGALYQRCGLGGCFTVSACVYAVSAWLGSGLSYRQETRRLVLGHVPRDLMEGLRHVRRDVVIGGVLAVTVAMNLMGFPYSALLAPIGRQVFHVSATLVGVLAAAEAFGAALGGAWLTTKEPRISGRVLMVGGSMLYMACVVAMPMMPSFWLAFGLLALGGFGSAAFSNMQTSLIVLHAPMPIRSRLMGLLTVCIGMGPLGILLMGTIADFAGPRMAIDIVASAGFAAVTAIGVVWRRRERRA
ncbi:MAG TPA: MFS transporter [Rhodopila sp.]|uniref:MFS transporter n=1 Tax=Rhodopila sp. TaxID=2480087 RepID=UPI002BC1677F|nr:MFS transporter [Rhodopila sp.]HVY14876.1 MFS transporter [Rhodopila sp.]